MLRRDASCNQRGVNPVPRNQPPKSSRHRVPAEVGTFRWSALVRLAALLVLPVWAVVRVGPAGLPKGLGIWMAAMSLFAFLAYFADKRVAQAQRGARRTPENVLHFLELIGGWPGGWLARDWLRHKSAKISFRVWSWLIIGSYQLVAADALLDWRMLGVLRNGLRQF